MPSNHLILCCPFVLLPSIFLSIRVFSDESALHIRWTKYWNFSFNISPSNEHPGLISFRISFRIDSFRIDSKDLPNQKLNHRLPRFRKITIWVKRKSLGSLSNLISLVKSFLTITLYPHLLYPILPKLQKKSLSLLGFLQSARKVLGILSFQAKPQAL